MGSAEGVCGTATVNYPDDVARIQRVLRAKGHGQYATLERCEAAWEAYSDSLFANWMMLPSSDETLYRCVLDHIDYGVRCCVCEDYEPNLALLQAPMMAEAARTGGKGYFGKLFRFCPWCGAELAIRWKDGAPGDPYPLNDPDGIIRWR